MGLILKSYYKNLPNATKCNSNSEVFESHEEKNVRVRVELNTIYGMLVILGIGVHVAITTFLIEVIWSIIGGKILQTTDLAFRLLPEMRDLYQ